MRYIIPTLASLVVLAAALVVGLAIRALVAVGRLAANDDDLTSP